MVTSNRESDVSSQTNSSLEFWIIYLRWGLGGWGFRILGLGQVLGPNNNHFIALMSVYVPVSDNTIMLCMNVLTH